MTAEPEFDFTGIHLPFPPTDGFTAQDLDRIPDLPPHTELIDGSLVFVSPQRIFHAEIIDLIKQSLRRFAPEKYEVVREITVTLGERQRPEPDVMVVHASALLGDPDQTDFSVGDVVLAVEVVSPESAERDRKRKPQLYAEARIEHFWRIESNSGRAVVHVHRLDPEAGEYRLTGTHEKQLSLDLPFPVEIDLTVLDRFGKR
ncbi:MAG TPA: Uma2 family endonuclease [Actinocrinis sp.]|nr:Uma2 family endonuclease [Actinocrinis sp.]